MRHATVVSYGEAGEISFIMGTLPHRPNVCMLIYNREKLLFLGERSGEPGVWQFPQGGVEPGLNVEENVVKEVCEELGLDREKFRVHKQLKATHTYDFKKPRDYSGTIWRGQSQTFWLVEFLGIDSDIKLDRYEAEFSAWRWCNVKQVREMAEPKRLPGYQDALKEFEEFNQQ